LKALLNSQMVLVKPWISAACLILAGIYQFTSFKNVCLSHCQNPFGFLMNHWQSGRWGAFLTGLKHGAFCTGCCWALMLLLFVLGVMNFVWIAVISIFVLLEKIVPNRWLLSRLTGVVLIVWAVRLVL